MTFVPNGSQEATVVAVSGENVTEDRTKPIRQPFEEAA
jgi:hypothetical protein